MRSKLTTLILSLLLVVFVTETLDAKGFIRKRRRTRNTNSARYNSYSSSISITGNAQQIAEQKAQIQANAGSCFHPGGSFGGGYAEGVGAGGTAAAALGNCCWFPGRIIGQAVVRSRNGLFYACRIYGR